MTMRRSYWRETRGADIAKSGTTVDLSKLAEITLVGTYPPDMQQRATELVLEQAEVLCKDWSS